MNCIQTEWARNFSERGELGAALSIWQHGQEIIHLMGGEARPGQNWQSNTLVPIFSATKPVAALCLLMALHERGASPELSVGEIWPHFPVPQCSIAQLLSHQAGLECLDTSAPIDDLDACRKAIESSQALWAPPRHAYHPQSFGPLLDITMLQLCGLRIGEYWERELRSRAQIDLFIGLPELEFERVAFLKAPRFHGKMPQSDFYREYFSAGTRVNRAFNSITGYNSAREMNTPAAWQCASPAKGGVASARGLAQFYQLLMGQGNIVPPRVLDWMSTPQVSGYDHSLMQHTSFTCGAMCQPQNLYPLGGFGHSGAGGSHAFCVPAKKLSFSYVMNQMQMGVLPSEKLSCLLHAYFDN